MTVSRWRSARPPSVSADSDRLTRSPSRQRLATSMRAVSRTSWLVRPRCTNRAAAGSLQVTWARRSASTGITGLPPPSLRRARSERSYAVASPAARTAPSTRAKSCSGTSPSVAWTSTQATSTSRTAWSTARSSTEAELRHDPGSSRAGAVMGRSALSSARVSGCAREGEEDRLVGPWRRRSKRSPPSGSQVPTRGLRRSSGSDDNTRPEAGPWRPRAGRSG